MSACKIEVTAGFPFCLRAFGIKGFHSQTIKVWLPFDGQQLKFPISNGIGRRKAPAALAADLLSKQDSAPCAIRPRA